ncbi:fatty acyl-CoA reductase wat-like [Drosophila sulfurigaster albostrigata]|uniref:fatty acyl-CoA reductase wat-like n=1 Tax=Drosophila sulfurigaster albostrigata TaxID=89887 RepID=UPI002D21907F|nr:fatty acyl-CoA reductase wat-like [Drosophila sulfurigaster albostrigata]
MESEMQSFYKNKTIFITGGSGFLGKVTIEKLLRSTQVKRIYVLVRPKKGVSIQDRIAAWDKDPLFSELRKSNANFLERIVPIAGDTQLPDLGISCTDRKLIVNETQILLHLAATVNFDERLYVALDINTRGTRLAVQLAKEMRQLEAFVHVSTAYSNCVLEHIGETFYPDNLSCSAEKVLELRELLSNDLIDKLTPGIIDKYPNTYTFTKALAEQIVQKEAQDLPACIFRPGMILTAYKEPTPGWVDNLLGPISIFYGCGIGVLRVMLVEKSGISHIVPVDYSANMILSMAWKTAKENAQNNGHSVEKQPTVYNFTNSDQNKLTWGQLAQSIIQKRHLVPLPNMLWFPFLKLFSQNWQFQLAILIYHILPGHFIDFVLRLRGQKPRMINVYKKIHKNIKRLSPFSLSSWTFEMNNANQLLQSMSPKDREIFQFDMATVDWDEYFTVALFGMRLYITKEKPTEESLRKATHTFNRFQLYNRILHVTIFAILAVLIWGLLKLFT